MKRNIQMEAKEMRETLESEKKAIERKFEIYKGKRAEMGQKMLQAQGEYATILNLISIFDGKDKKGGKSEGKEGHGKVEKGSGKGDKEVPSV